MDNSYSCFRISKSWRTVAAAALCACASAASAAMYRVTPDAAGGGTGQSWSSPMTIAEAVAAATSDGDTILCKAGEYDIAGQIAISTPITVKGGLAGTDDTTLDPTGKTTLNAFDRTDFSYIVSVTTATTGATNVFENICFTRAYRRGVAKTGKSHIVFRNCRFFRNGVRWLQTAANTTTVDGGGINLSGSSAAEAYFENCLFDGNAHTNFVARNSSLRGAGISASAMKRVYVDNCDFLTNCVQHAAFSRHGEVGQDGSNDGGAAIWVYDSPITVRTSRFVANRGPGRDVRGGTVRLTGNCSGSAFTNCLFYGNKTTHTAGGATTCGAAISLRMAATVCRVEVIGCTFAYNYSQSATSGAGLTVSMGTAYVRNCIFYGNHVSDSSHTAHYGRDLVVLTEGRADVDYSLVTGEGEYYISAVKADYLALGEHMVYGDPLFGTTLADAKTAVNGANAAANVAAILAFDLHEGGLGSGYSRAIDGAEPAAPYANEPSPNGGLRNLGYYGNTAEAATSQLGAPALSDGVAISFAADTVPTVAATLGGSGLYNANVKIELSKTYGGAAVESVIKSAVQPGDTVTLNGVDLYEPGSTVYVRITVNAPGQTELVFEKSATVTGTLPPYYGHGGGANVVHVREGAKGRKDGSDWTDAFDSFALAQASLAGNATKTEMWVAGTITEVYAPSTVTIAAPLVIRGGFAGTEDSPAERAEGTYSTLDGNNAYDLLKLANAAANPLAVERMIFTRAGQYAFVNSGVGALAVANCQFIGNIAPKGDVTGRGVNLANAFTASFTNCVWRGNMKTGGGSSQTQGSAIYASGLSRLVLDDCLFVTNGMSAVGGTAGSSPGRDQCDGDCLWMNGTPITARNCHFRGNRGGIRSGSNGTISGTGGVILLSGTSGGSAFTNCTFAGNWGGWAEGSIATSAMGAGGGALDIRLSTTAGKVDFERCTLAYNLGDSRYCPGGLNVERGTVSMHNSIIYGNVRGSNATVGHDIHVLENGRLNLSYCMLTAEDVETSGKPSSTYVSEASAGLITYDHLKFGDPQFATGHDVFTPYVKTSGAYTYLQNNAVGASFLANIDLHLRSVVGMSRNDGSRYEDDDRYSTAIDAGDPASPFASEPDPNGGRVNLGGYGNTSEASCSMANIQPEIGVVEVVYSNGVARPVFSIPITGSGTFLADVTVYAGTGDVIAAGCPYTNTCHNVRNGDRLLIPLNSCAVSGDTVSWRIVVSCDNASTRETSGSAVVPPGLVIPELDGKGGGAGIIHVGPGYVASLRDGTSWWDAYETVEEALAAMTPARHEIWVAADAVNRMPSAMSFEKSFKTIIRGGFTGMENTPEERPAGLDSVFGDPDAQTLLTIGKTSDITIERFRFERAKLRALSKSGAGDLDLVSCAFVSNGFSSAGTAKSVYPGKAVAFSGSGALSVTDCVFAYNCQTNNAYTTGGPGAALAVNSGRARVADSVFFANCLPFAVPNYGSSYTTLYDSFPYGSAIYATAPVCIERCDFRANLCNTRSSNNNNGGVVYFASGSSGSAVTNCLFAGNVDRASWNLQASTRTGSIVLSLGAKEQAVDIYGSTFAYNLSDTSAGSAGVTVHTGTANVKNCVFTGNHIRRGAPDDTSDLRVVGENGAINLSYSVLDGDLGAVRSSCLGDFTEGPGVIAADPLLVTRPETVTNLITYTGGYYYYPAGTEENMRGINAHLRGGAGYFDEKTGGLVLDYVRPDNSPAIDAGDPASDYRTEPVIPGVGGNGHRVNLGYYGNTPWATMSKPRMTMLIMR